MDERTQWLSRVDRAIAELRGTPAPRPQNKNVSDTESTETMSRSTQTGSAGSPSA